MPATPTSLYTATKASPTSEQLLINTLKQSTAISLASGQSPALAAMKLMLLDIQSGLTHTVAHQAPKLFELRKAQRLGEKDTLKLLVFLLKTFQDSIKVKEGMDAADLIEAAEMILEKYSHDSLKDVMLALKEAKWSGHNFYNALSGPKVMEVLNLYFDAKALRLEAEHRQQKAQPVPKLLNGLSADVAAKFLEAVTPPKPPFDEAEYRRQKAAYYTQRILYAGQDENLNRESIIDQEQEAA